jgi:hypothetical protein
MANSLIIYGCFDEVFESTSFCIIIFVAFVPTFYTTSRLEFMYTTFLTILALSNKILNC